MKNLKKVLSLVLAMAMAMSLMATSFAADKDYADYDKVSYNEAVDVMSAVGVFQGNKGSFDPAGSLTREQAAKIVTYMLMGQQKADKLTTAVAPYADVKADRWSAGSIAYCTNEGILAGTGNGKFNPTGKLTGLEFAKMLLAALGYNAQIEKLVGNAWAINASKLAINAGLDADMEDVVLTGVLTREEAAQMAFNTMKTTMVDYENLGTDINMGDVSINVGASKAAEVPQGKYEDTLNEEFLQFAEKHFPKLTKSDTASDDFGRPAHAWDYDTETDISVAADTAKFVYTAKMDADDVNKDLKKYTSAEKLEYVVNSLVAEVGSLTAEPSALVNDIAGLTGNGITVEVFTDKKVVTNIVVIEPVFAEVATKDTKANKEHGAYTTYTVAQKSAKDFTTVVDEDKDKDTAFITGTVADGDMVLVYPDQKDNLYIAAVDTISGVVSRVSTKDDKTTLTVDKKAYEMSDVAGADAPAVNKDSKDLYVDSFGYVLAAVAEDAEDAKTILVTDAYKTLTDNKLVDQVSGIAGNGETIKLNVSANAGDTAPAAGYVYTYAEDKDTDDKDDYLFTEADAFAQEITKSTKTVSYQDNTYYFDSKVKFIFAGNAFGEVKAKDVVVKDGLQEVKNAEIALATKVVDDTNYITAVYVGGKVAGGTVTSDDIIYIAEKTGVENILIDDKSTEVNVYEAYINGEKTSIVSEDVVEPNFYKSEKDAENGLYTLTGNVYDEAKGENAVAVNVAIDSEVNNIVNGTYDISKAVVTDLTENGDGVVEGKLMSIIFNADTNNVAYVYVDDDVIVAD